MKYSELPVKLPHNSSISNKGVSPLSNDNKWLTVSCPICISKAMRETDTMDTFICSSWYYLRYVDSNNLHEPFQKKLINDWLPVDQYVGGIEHAILHL